MTSAQPPTTRSDGGLPVDPGSSLRALTARFHEAGTAASAPLAEALVGRHKAYRVGPRWIRLLAPGFLAITGMPGWWGKEFSRVSDGHSDDRLHGHNLVMRRGTVTLSLPMEAAIGTSRVDRHPALVATYRSTAPYPWRSVVDEIRPVAPGVLLGLSFGVPLAPRGGIPFVLVRETTSTPVGT